MKKTALYGCILYSLVVASGCEGNEKAGQAPPGTLSVPKPSAPTNTSPTQVSKLLCLPELKAMLRWYGASQRQADTIHQFHFMRYSTPNLKKAYYVIDSSEVARYISFLRKSGFFSEKYLSSELENLQYLQRQYEKHHKTPDDENPTDFAVDRLVGVTNADDILNYNHYVKKFRVGAKKNMLIFETGESTVSYTFDGNCKIESVEW